MLKNKSLQRFTLWVDQHQDVMVHTIALLFLVTGLIYSLYLGNNLRFPDETQYYRIADNIAAGNGYSIKDAEPTALRPPLYPLFLSFFSILGAPIIILRYLNFIILTISLYLIRSILKYEQHESGSGLAAFLLLGYGVLFYTAGTLYPQTLFTLLLLCIIRLIIIEDFGYRCSILLGLLSGAIILTHPTGIFIPPLAVIWRFYPRNYHIIIKGVLAAIIAVLCISVWSYRNYKTFDRFIPLTSHGGDTLYIGNNPNTSIESWYSYFDEGRHLEASKLSESEENRYYFKKTLEFWTEHTGQAVRLYLYKVLYHFNYRNNFAVRNQTRTVYDIIMFITYYPLLLCLALRLVCRFWPRIPFTRTETLLVSIYLISALFHAIFLPRIRFRLPYDVVLICHIGIIFSVFKQRFWDTQPTIPEEKDPLLS